MTLKVFCCFSHLARGTGLALALASIDSSCYEHVSFRWKALNWECLQWLQLWRIADPPVLAGVPGPEKRELTIGRVADTMQAQESGGHPTSHLLPCWLAPCGRDCEQCPDYSGFTQGFAKTARRMLSLFKGYPFSTGVARDTAGLDIDNLCHALRWFADQENQCSGCARGQCATTSRLLPGCDPGCPIRLCARSKDVGLCVFCRSFPCEHSGYSRHGLANLLEIQRTGLERWLADRAAQSTTAGSSSLSGITEMLELYSTAFNNHDPFGVASTLALDDPRFSEFEDVVPGLMRAADVMRMLQNVTQSSGFGMRFENVDVCELAEGIAIVTGIQKSRTLKSGDEVEFQSRVSLVATRASDGRWRIVHGHFSSVP